MFIADKGHFTGWCVWTYKYISYLYQLPSVLQPMLFEQTSHSYTFLHKSGSLWKDCFKLFELTETVCQKDNKRFAELLGRFRTGDCTAEDFILLQSCQITQNDVTYPLHLEQMLMLISTTMKCLRNHVQDMCRTYITFNSCRRFSLWWNFYCIY